MAYNELMRCPECGTVCESAYWEVTEDADRCPMCGWEGIALPMKAGEENGQMVYREE